MQPLDEHPSAVRLTIPGKYWDSQLYSGTLYLFGISGDLLTLDWDRLVDDIQFPPTLRVAADLALNGNQRLYEMGAQRLMRDPTIRGLLERKFRKLSLMPPWEVALPNSGMTDNPLPFPHNDSEVHYNRLYVAASEGLYASTAPDRGEPGRSMQLSEVPALRIAAKYRTMAQASGSDGLFAVRLSEVGEAGRSAELNTQVSKLPCASCEWAFNSVVATGYDKSVYLAPFELAGREQANRRRQGRQRTFTRIISSDEIFGDDLFSATESEPRGFSWGAGDRLFRLTEGHIGVIKYAPRAAKPPRFDVKGTIELDDTTIDSAIVAARVAPFGSVIEKDDSLVILLSTDQTFELPGEPTNWRVFPRSKNYVNHLHVIYNDHLEIWAFTHDYFVNQADKLSGIDASSAND